ncbi:hypothetical protein WK03_14975 [Burkholderia cepacia]|nr:hypothetical protein WK03_14975 [Burkholderia cepacia]
MSGRGIVLRQKWGVRALLDSGAPVQVLPGVAQPVNVWAVYPARLAASAKVRVCVDFLADGFGRMAWPAVFDANPPLCHGRRIVRPRCRGASLHDRMR